ncbi:MAG: hypothetical protein H7Z43_10885, partial [Clostridia bacterium]|nr:hypothetical protein [Deltaproteobacteria bacterium]
GEYSRATELLNAASQEVDRPLPRIAYERGLIATELGHLDAALDELARAADGDPESNARIDAAAVLVELGRFPDAVAALRQSADERGSSFPLDVLISDARFARIRSFTPYLELVNQVRDEQAGPLGRILLRLERIEESARAVRDTFDELALAMSYIARVLGAVSASLLVFVFFALLVTFGVRQLGLLDAPWTLVLGVVTASIIWSWGASVATLGESHGLRTITGGVAVIFAPWVAVVGTRYGLRKLEERRRGDPFRGAELPTTLALVDELAKSARQLLDAAAADQEVAERRVTAARKALLQRLTAPRWPTFR